MTANLPPLPVEPAEVGTCSCGHGWQYHGPEVPGCCECRCRLLHRAALTPEVER